MGEMSPLWMKRNKKKRLTQRLGGNGSVGSWFNATVLTCLGLFLNADYGFAFSCRIKKKPKELKLRRFYVA